MVRDRPLHPPGCRAAATESAASRRHPPRSWSGWSLAAPPMTGAEYLTAEVLERSVAGTGCGLRRSRLAESKCGIQDFLKRRNPAWNLVGRVHFNLAENRKDPDAPFAFLATYTTRLSANAKAQHLPLGKALGEYAGAANKDRLLSLLLPVQRASETCPWLKDMVDAGEIFHPLRWTPEEAMQLLKDVPQLESAGVVVRMPAAWRANRPPRPQVSAQDRRQGAGGAGPGSAARFPDGGHARRRTADGRRDPGAVGEIRRAGAGPRPLGGGGRGAAAPHDGALPRGRAHGGGERARLSGGDAPARRRRCRGRRWLRGRACRVVPGGRRSLAGGDAERAAQPGGIGPGRSRRGAERDPAALPAGGRALAVSRREARASGPAWPTTWDWARPSRCSRCCSCSSAQTGGQPQPSLLVAPASLLANWAAEIERFAPGLKALIAHPSALPAAELKTIAPERLRDVDLVITSYGSLLRVPWIAEDGLAPGGPGRGAGHQEPGCQADPGRQERCKARARFALTGTPDREPARRSVVDLRLHQSGAAGIVEGVRRLRQRPGETGRTIRTARCANWCGPTFCGG